MEGLWKKIILMQQENEKLMEITPEELAEFDGKDGRPAFVAVHDFVYDVTAYMSTIWASGSHFGIMAGTDATVFFDTCHNHTILQKLRIVGRLVH